MNMNMKCATAYKRQNLLFLHGSSQTSAGVWIACAPFLRVEPQALQAVVGDAVLESLASSKQGIAHPTNWTGLVEPMFALAGVKSWAIFMKNSSCVGIEQNNTLLKLIPQRNLGTKEGFEPIFNKIVELPSQASAKEIGESLDSAFALCE